MIAGLIARFGAPAVEKAGKIGLIVVLVLLLGTCAVLRIRQDAVRDERARVEAVRVAAELLQREAERAADVIFRDEQARARADSEQRRKEIDDATRNLPDQAPSDRQRVRACLELRRQAEAAGEPAPAC